MTFPATVFISAARSFCLEFYGMAYDFGMAYDCGMVYDCPADFVLRSDQ